MPQRALIVSTFECGLQPLSAASLAASFVEHGVDTTVWDADVFPDDPPPHDDVDLVVVSTPLFEGLERGLSLAKDFTASGKRVVACGQYARLFASEFATVCEGVIMEEPETAVEGLVRRLEDPEVALPDGIRTSSTFVPLPKPITRRWQLPARGLLPEIGRYPAHHSDFGLMGNLEATRGCHHRCVYCSVFAAYSARVVPIPVDVVLADAVQLADQGATHFAFIDAEFFNMRRHGIKAMEAITAELGPCTYELTTRMDHLVEFAEVLPEMRELGLRRVTSALEFPSDRVLTALEKEADVDLMRQAVRTVHDAGVQLAPTFIPFTPWVTYEELLGFDDFLQEMDLADRVSPTARQTRLYLYKGSPLLDTSSLEGVTLVERDLDYDWVHTDPRVDDLWHQMRADAETAGFERCCVRC
jgi:radical SAM superfamily enzyme YgiQ (UPF0313 family)